MKIQSSNIMMNSQHVSVSEETNSESRKVWVGNQRPDFEKMSGVIAQVSGSDSVDLSEQSKSVDHAQRGMDRSIRSKYNADETTESDSVSKIINMLMELITGKKVNLKAITPQTDSVDPQTTSDLTSSASQAAELASPQSLQQQSASVGFGFEYDSKKSVFESESMSYSAQGVIKTSDGNQIDFNFKFSIQRVFTSEETTSIRLGDAILNQQDPLVINFSGTAAQLTDTKFSFDINMDGTAEQISFVEPNSGFIALDKNNDGSINDGSELFGTASGNGFQDLSVYDQDKNGWIDDNDNVFSKLQVWRKDAHGHDSLTGLKISGVGALYLGNVSTQFDLKTTSNESLGTLKASSVYLNENGTTGVIQDIDLTL